MIIAVATIYCLEGAPGWQVEGVISLATETIGFCPTVSEVDKIVSITSPYVLAVTIHHSVSDVDLVIVAMELLLESDISILLSSGSWVIF